MSSLLLLAYIVTTFGICVLNFAQELEIAPVLAVPRICGENGLTINLQHYYTLLIIQMKIFLFLWLLFKNTCLWEFSPLP